MFGRSKAEHHSKPFSRLRRLLSHGNLWIYILSLMKRKKVYAYALPQHIFSKFGFLPSKLMIYFVLYKLESEGLIASSFEERRKYYALTRKGKQELLRAKKFLAQLSRRL
ncbi:MAG: PadR family transcriptional regulator [Candidatus Anstonellaceae archaeon]